MRLADGEAGPYREGRSLEGPDEYPMRAKKSEKRGRRVARLPAVMARP
jgi:hypothetical protein